MDARQTILVMAGGTGGHVFPALAVAQALRAREQKVHWLGSLGGMEEDVVPQAEIPLHLIKVSGLRGKGIVALLIAPLRLIRACWQANSVIRCVQPNLVLGFGGFAAGPGGLVAWLRRISLVVHEQNAVAGTTNKVLSKFAKRVLQAFPHTLPAGETLGNPVRAEIESLPLPQARLAGRSGPFRLLVLGGSQGAHAINSLVPAAVSELTADIEIWHQCGKRWQDETQEQYRQCKHKVRIDPFITDMAAAYEWADLVICRAGAMTVSELMSAGLASLLIPFPYAIDDHQTANGQWLVDANAAIMIAEADLTSNRLASELTGMLGREKILGMALAARSLAQINSAGRIADICMEVADV